MTLPTLRKLAWLSVFLCFLSWFVTAGPLNGDQEGVRVKRVAPIPNDPAFLI